MATKCTYGPDENGQFIIDQVVPDRTAESCDPDNCICTSHDDYHSIVGQRLQNQKDEETVVPDPVEEEEEEEVIRPVDPDPVSENDDEEETENDGFELRLKPAPLSMEEYD